MKNYLTKKCKAIIYISLILFFAFILFLCPIMGDDWSNYIEGSKGLRHVFGYTIGMYFDWEGRIASRFLITLLTYHKFIWNILNSLVIVFIIYLINKIVKPKNEKLVLLLSILIILFMNIFTFSEVIVWIAGNITYVFVMPLLLYYLYLQIDSKKTNKFVLILLNIIIPMFVEHVGVILVLINLFLLIYKYKKDKEFSKELFMYLIISIISLSSMLLSPGTHKRSLVENTYFNSLNIIEKVIYNIHNFVYYTYIIYPYLSVLVFIGNIKLIKGNIKHKSLSILLYLFFSISLFISIIYILSLFNSYFDVSNNIFIIIYYLIYTFISFLLIYKYSSRKILFYYLIGLLFNLCMLLSPTWGFRTSFASYLFLSIAYIMINSSDDNNCYVNIILGILVIISVIFYISLYISVYRQNKENVEIIIKHKNDDVIEIKKEPLYAGCNLNPSDVYHLSKFKEYYGINKNSKVKIVNNNWKFIFYLGEN